MFANFKFHNNFDLGDLFTHHDILMRFKVKDNMSVNIFWTKYYSSSYLNAVYVYRDILIAIDANW